MRLYQAKVNKVFNPLAHFWNSQVEANAIDKIIKLIREDRDKLLASLGVGFTDVDSLELPAEKQLSIYKLTINEWDAPNRSNSVVENNPCPATIL